MLSGLVVWVLFSGLLGFVTSATGGLGLGCFVCFIILVDYL